MLSFLYESTERDRVEVLGDYYRPPKKFVHGEDTKVATIGKRDDGQTVEVYECRMPATFFKLKVLPDKDYKGHPLEGYEVSTGSGSEMAELAGRLAVAISEGMIGFNRNRLTDGDSKK
jgi:hypothetical protein